MVYRQTEQLNILRPQIIVGSVGTVSFALFCWYFMWEKHIDQQVLTVWSLIAVTSGCLNFLYAVLSGRFNDGSAPSLKRQLHTFTLLGFVTGVIWSFPNLLIFNMDVTDTDNIFLMIFIVIGMMGMGTSALGSVTAYLPMYYCSALPFLLSLIAAFLFSTTTTIPAFSIGIMLIIYVGALCGFAFFINQTLIESIDLRKSNLELADRYLIEKENAEQANMAKSRFLASASHDLRQPLHALTFLVEALKSSKDLESVEKISHSIESSTDALRELLSVILDLSKIEAGAIQPRITSIPVQQVFDKLSDNFVHLAEDKGLTLKFISTNRWVLSDMALLERILMNIVSNAIRYTDNGSVLVSCRHKQGKICIQVWDTGCGIHPDDIDNIYKEYYQVANRERDRSLGLGLGLSIVAGFSEALGHRIEVKSVQGRGSVFGLSLPESNKKHVQLQEDLNSINDSVPTSSILIVDDDPAVLAAISQSVISWGYKVEVAATVEEAEHIVHQGFLPDLALCDYRLKGDLTGVDLIQRLIKRFLPDLKGIVITGDTDPKRITEARNSGFMLLHKPLRPAKLRAAMMNLQSSTSGRTGTTPVGVMESS